MARRGGRGVRGEEWPPLTPPTCRHWQISPPPWALGSDILSSTPSPAAQQSEPTPAEWASYVRETAWLEKHGYWKSETPPSAPPHASVVAPPERAVASSRSGCRWRATAPLTPQETRQLALAQRSWRVLAAGSCPPVRASQKMSSYASELDMSSPPPSDQSTAVTAALCPRQMPIRSHRPEVTKSSMEPWLVPTASAPPSGANASDWPTVSASSRWNWPLWCSEAACNRRMSPESRAIARRSPSGEKASAMVAAGSVRAASCRRSCGGWREGRGVVERRAGR